MNAEKAGRDAAALDISERAIKEQMRAVREPMSEAERAKHDAFCDGLQLASLIAKGVAPQQPRR